MQNDTPFVLLERLDRDCLATAKGLPEEVRAPVRWKGVLFGLNGLSLLAPMAEIAEIVTPLRVTHVPGAKSWVLGLANMRGNLLPVMDLTGFLFGKNSRQDPRRQRILVMREGDLFAGMVVDSVTGLKQYTADCWQAETQVGVPVLHRYLDGAYLEGGLRYPVFRLARLAQDEAFVEVQL